MPSRHRMQLIQLSRQNVRFILSKNRHLWFLLFNESINLNSNQSECR